MTDTHSEIKNFVAEWRTKYETTVAEDDSKGLEDLIGSMDVRSRWVALGMLYLGEVEEAQRWFGIIAPEFIQLGREQSGLVEDQEATAAGSMPGVDLERGIQAAVLSGDEDLVAEIVEEAHQIATDPSVETVPDPNWPFLGLVRALTAVLGADDDTAAALEEFRERIAASDDPDAESYFEPLATATEGFHREDPSLVREGIEGYLKWHDQRLSGYDAEYEIVEQGVEVKSCTFLVLAHRRGLDVHVDSEYVPETVYELP